MKRKKLGVLFQFRKGWMGGIIYIINLVNALEFLPEEEQPDIVLFYKDDLEEFLKDIRYKRVTPVRLNMPGLFKAYLRSFFTRKNVFVSDLINQYQLDGIYPLNDQPVKNDQKHARVVAWIPDLQHKFYPHFFGRKRTFMREVRIRILLSNTTDLVVSSHDVESHFRKFYSIRPSMRIHRLRFVTSFDSFDFASLADLQKTYPVPDRYYMVSNQFTNHKNHHAIMEALKMLNEEGMNIHVVFTGKMEFKGNEAYIAGLRKMVADYGLTTQTHFLGIIPRKDQLALMKRSVAVLQPSLFEGWSTVIEDAKSVQVPVLAANLGVNMEQLGDLGTFFSPDNYRQFADCMKAAWQQPKHCVYPPYEDRVRQFAYDFMSIFKD